MGGKYDQLETIIQERTLLFEQRIKAIERNVEREDDRFRHLLEGFPQLYSTKAEVEQVRNIAEDVKQHLVGRESFDDLKEKVDNHTGFRTSMIAAAGVIMTIIVLLLGVVISQIPTRDQISAQVKAEAPWVTDKPQIQADLNRQHEEIQQMENQITALSARVAYLCKTAKPKC